MRVEEPSETPDSASTPYSVLMSVYDGDDAAHFATAIDSILNQTVPSDDIVLTIDGPLTGDLAATVERYIANSPQIRPIRFPKNIGLGAVRSVGLPECRHDIVLIMDSDDISAPDRAKKEIEFLTQHPEVDVVSATLTEFVGEPDNIVAQKRIPLAHEEIVQRARRWNPINHAATAFRKSSVLAVGGYQDFPRHEDYHLWVRMMKSGYRFATIDVPLINVRISGDALERRRSFPTVVSSIRFHLWKRQIGFADTLDTTLMIGFMCAVKIIPGPMYQSIYRAKRRYRSHHSGSKPSSSKPSSSKPSSNKP